MGIVGTGLLAVPVLVGSAAYVVGKARQWPTGLKRRSQEAQAFYCDTGDCHACRHDHQFPTS
ncbi:hypothetical protein [Gluconobacter frateurii]|uniref:hypothetical protein n=1 Tax=Gluconobacter frateurii TaxID=38308 RepID=UPI0038D1F568